MSEDVHGMLMFFDIATRTYPATYMLPMLRTPEFLCFLRSCSRHNFAGAVALVAFWDRLSVAYPPPHLILLV
jgi:hypothetical protein